MQKTNKQFFQGLRVRRTKAAEEAAAEAAAEAKAAHEAAAVARAKAANEEAAELAAKAEAATEAAATAAAKAEVASEEAAEAEAASGAANDEKAPGKKRAAVLSDSEDDEDESRLRAQKARYNQDALRGARAAEDDTMEPAEEYSERKLSAEEATLAAQEILKAANADQEAFVKLLGDVKNKLKDDALLNAFFCQSNGVLFCENLKKRKKEEYKTYFQVRKEGLYAITCNASENDKITPTFRLSFACEIQFENYTVWINKKDHGKTSIMIETKTETTFETLVLLPSGKKLDKRPSSESNAKSMWDWFTAHFIEGIRETIVRGAPSKTVIYGSEAYIIKGTITPAKGSKPEATKITKAVKVPLHSITLGRLVILAKEGKALATIIKDKVAVDTLTLTNIETIQLKDPSKVTPRLNYKNDQFKMLKSMYAGKDLKSHFNLKEPEKKAAGKASPQTASRCFPAVGNLTMTANNSTYLSYPRNSTWNLGHLKAFENEVKKILLTGIATDADIQQWADFCIAQLQTALGLLDADDLNLDEAMESDEGEAGPPEEVESRRVAEDHRLRAEARRNGLNNVNEDEFESGKFLAQFASDDDMHGSEDEGGAPTDPHGDILRDAFELTPSSPQGSQAEDSSPLPLLSPSELATPNPNGFNRGAAAATPAPAAGTPLHWQNTPRMQQPQNIEFNDRGTPAGIRLPTPAAGAPLPVGSGTPAGIRLPTPAAGAPLPVGGANNGQTQLQGRDTPPPVGNYTPLSFGDTPYYTTPSATQAARDVLSPEYISAAEALQQLKRTNARFVDKCLSFY